jgi:hypothetical protein
MKGNPDGSLSSRVRLGRRRCSLSGISMGFIEDWLLLATLGSNEHKVIAGGAPANPAALAEKRGNPV